MFHILVADDDKNTRLLLRAVLEAEHYTVYTACNGREALEVLEREHIDLVVLDIMMPQMDGYEFTAALRAEQNNLSILMISAKQLPADKRRGFFAGIDDYMTKPLDEEEMLWRIKALLRRRKLPVNAKLSLMILYSITTRRRSAKTARCRSFRRRSFSSSTNCSLIRERFLPVSSSWMKSGDRTAVRAGRL